MGKQFGIYLTVIIVAANICRLPAQIVFSSFSHDFEILTNWSETPAIFEFENKGDKREAIFNAVRSANVHVKYPASYIEPGEKGRVLIYFEPQKIGRFNEKVKLNTSSSDVAFEFQIRGTVDSWMECPSVNLPADKKLLISEQKGMVIDAMSKELISDAELRFTDSRGKSKNVKANRHGHFKSDLSAAMYHIRISANDYHDLEEMMYLNKNTAELVFELMPKIPEIAFKESRDAERLRPSVTTSVTIITEGIVVDDSTKAPLPRASVTLLNLDSRATYFYKTLSDGRFSRRLKTGDYLISCAAKDYLPFSDTFSIVEEKNDIRIALKKDPAMYESIIIPEYFVKGFILDIEDLSPIKDAEVCFKNELGRIICEKSRNDGSFSSLLLPGKYAVHVSADNYSPNRNGTLNVMGELENVFYYLLPRQLEVIIRDMDSGKTRIVFEDAIEVPVIDLDSLQPVVMAEEAVFEAEEVLARNIYAANNIVFLIDVSGSMRFQNKMNHLKIAMSRMTHALRDIDRLTLITFANVQRVHFIALPANNKDSILKSIESLNSFGMTYGIKGLGIAYEIAREKYIEGGNNQVIIATDGDFNSPEYSNHELMRLVRRYAREGIKLSIVGFGDDPQLIRRMSAMAALGKGGFMLVQNEEEARSTLINEIKERSLIEYDPSK